MLLPLVSGTHAATKASLMNLLEIPFAYLMQYFLFGDAVEPLGLGGVALVAGASLLNLCFAIDRGQRRAPVLGSSLLTRDSTVMSALFVTGLC